MFNYTQPPLANLNSSEFSSPVSQIVIDEIFSDAIYVFISFVGFLSNSVALFVLSSTVGIRKSRPYILLMNQCLMDILSALSGLINVFAKYAFKNVAMEGAGGELYCNIVNSQLGFAVHVCASSYNLASLSAERMFSVVWPIRHRVSFTPNNMKRVAVMMWLFSIAVIHFQFEWTASESMENVISGRYNRKLIC